MNTIALNKITLEQAEYWSSFQVMTTQLRAKGIKIDMQAIERGINQMTPVLELLKAKLLIDLGVDPEIKFNLESPKQLTKILQRLGYKLPVSNKGNPSCNAKWLKLNSKDPLIKLLIEYRSTNKLLKDFFIKLKNMQQWTCPEAYHGAPFGRLYPELNIFGAKRTGRFSSSNPNSQQMPKRNARWAKLIRAIFVPENPKNNLYSLDWSNQEGRLQVHYAVAIHATGAVELADRLIKDPSLDLHKCTYSNMFQIPYEKVTGLQKDQIKPINLGLAYGMQSGSLAKAISLPTKMITSNKGYSFEVAGQEAQQILDRHKSANPYLYELIDFARDRLIKQGFITTLDGRKLCRSADGRDYTGLSKKIQGSAADMMYKALSMAHQQKVDIKLIIHDEFLIEGQLDDARRMCYIMQSTHKFNVPMIADIKQGKSWGEMEKLKL